MTLIYKKRSKDQSLGQAASSHIGLSINIAKENKNPEVEQSNRRQTQAVRKSLRTHENIEGATGYKTRKRKNEIEPKRSEYNPVPISTNIEYNTRDKTPTAQYKQAQCIKDIDISKAQARYQLKSVRPSSRSCLLYTSPSPRDS